MLRRLQGGGVVQPRRKRLGAIVWQVLSSGCQLRPRGRRRAPASHPFRARTPLRPSLTLPSVCHLHPSSRCIFIPGAVPKAMLFPAFSPDLITLLACTAPPPSVPPAITSTLPCVGSFPMCGRPVILMLLSVSFPHTPPFSFSLFPSFFPLVARACRRVHASRRVIPGRPPQHRRTAVGLHCRLALSVLACPYVRASLRRSRCVRVPRLARLAAMGSRAIRPRPPSSPWGVRSDSADA